MKQRLLLLLKIVYWMSPLVFWLFWQIILANPQELWYLLLAVMVLLVPVSYEAAGRKRGRRFFFIFLSLGMLLSSFYLFISFLSSSWQVEILWLLLLAYIYRYLFTAYRMSHGGSTDDWRLVSLYGGLLTVFLASTSFFGLLSFLSLSPWPLLASFIPFVVASTYSLAYSQEWLRKSDRWLWPLLSILPLQIVMMLSLLPLNYLITGILSTLAYYSMINFVRLYSINNLTRRKIQNYAWFTALSLIIILLTARWL
ncbi:MAG: hypothetical protein Q8Q67_04220 [bacterium]|nr:hypothetical protein [bacterium]